MTGMSPGRGAKGAVDAVFNMIEELFNPGRRHTDEEKKRLELSRADVDDNDPGRGPIDLDSGRVLIRLGEEPVQGG